MPTVFEAHSTPKVKVSEKHTPISLQKDTRTNSESKMSIHRYMHAFCVYPKTTFEGQNKNETVILLLRAHPITQIPWIISAVALFIVPTFISFLLKDFFQVRQLIFLIGFWYAFLYSYILINILNYLFNVGIITNERIIDVDYFNILYKEVNMTVHSQIQDVTTKTGGFIRSMFRFGNIFIQTAGAEINIEFLDIPQPTKAARIIHDLMQAISNKK